MILSKQIWFAVVVALALGTSACDRGLKSHQDQAPQATPAVVEKLDAAEEAEATSDPNEPLPPHVKVTRGRSPRADGD